MAYIKRIAFRHLSAIKHQVIGAIGMICKAKPNFDLKTWLDEEAPDLVKHIPDLSLETDLYLKHSSDSLVQNYAMLLNYCCLSYECSLQNDKGMGDVFIESLKSTSISDYQAEDYFGSNLGGMWDIDAFIIRSSIVLTLSVIEEFERGLIRILIVHRKNNSEVSLFVPRLEDYLKQSEEWKKIKKSTHTIGGRHKILKKYLINPSPKTAWYKRLSEVRKKRNEIAHGLDSPELKLEQYLTIYHDVWRMVNHYSNEMQLKQKIEL